MNHFEASWFYFLFPGLITRKVEFEKMGELTTVGEMWSFGNIFWFNPLSANPTKWSATLKQFVGHFVGLALKRLITLAAWTIKNFLLFLKLSTNMLESHAEAKIYLVFSAISILEQKNGKKYTTEFVCFFLNHFCFESINHTGVAKATIPSHSFLFMLSQSKCFFLHCMINILRHEKISYRNDELIIL